ncbi:MAG: SpoIID/LytB domain-containing protein [Acaryochloris sp. RU_4_1]|nr:SpoIID/LytB domain-containing protein [Acaryochloris sp. RU_4_1]
MSNLLGRFFQTPATFQGYSGSSLLVSTEIKIADQVTITCSHNFHLRVGRNILLKGDPDTQLELSVMNSHIACNGRTFAVAPDGFQIYPDCNGYADAQFQVDAQGWYRGSLYICLRENQVSATNSLGLSRFLYQVLPHQVPMGWPIEAIKAQAIVSRAIALLSPACLPYGDLDDVYEQSIKAVDETDGLVLSSRPGMLRSFDDLKFTVVCNFDANRAYELALQGLMAEQILASLCPNVFVGRIAIGFGG